MVENVRSLSALANPYTNINKNSSIGPVMASHYEVVDNSRLLMPNAVEAGQIQRSSSTVQKLSSSIGILPGINQPLPVGLPSLAEYG